MARRDERDRPFRFRAEEPPPEPVSATVVWPIPPQQAVRARHSAWCPHAECHTVVLGWSAAELDRHMASHLRRRHG